MLEEGDGYLNDWLLSEFHKHFCLGCFKDEVAHTLTENRVLQNSKHPFLTVRSPFTVHLSKPVLVVIWRCGGDSSYQECFLELFLYNSWVKHLTTSVIFFMKYFCCQFVGEIMQHTWWTSTIGVLSSNEHFSCSIPLMHPLTRCLNNSFPLNFP